MKALFSACLLGVALSGCAQIDGKIRGWLASQEPAHAVLAGERFAGTATLYTDRSGTLQLSPVGSGLGPQRVCVGPLRYLGTGHGLVSLRCAGGEPVLLPFTQLSPTSGHAVGRTPQGDAVLVWGMAANAAAAYLPLPAMPVMAVPPAPSASAPAP